jgi:hypothetical protein
VYLVARTREELRLDLLADLKARAAKLPGAAKAPAAAGPQDSPAAAAEAAAGQPGPAPA